MSEQKYTCFVSYCHSDIDREVLHYLRFMLEENSRQKYDFLLDEDLPPGANLDEFMALLDKVDAVIILLTPEYKNKVKDRKGGAYTEYTRIVNRYFSHLQQRKRGVKSSKVTGYFELIPILISGDNSNAVPEELLNVKYSNLVGIRVSKNQKGKYIITDFIRQNYLPKINGITETLNAISSIKSESFEELYKRYFPSLFVDLKANPRSVNQGFINRLFVKTYSFSKVANQNVLFIIGRKGSGKSTIAELVELLNKEKYKGRVTIIADNFNLGSIFELFDNQGIRSDTKAAVKRSDCFQYAWEAFFIICCIEIIVNLYKKEKLNKYQKSHSHSLNDYLKVLQGPWAQSDDQTKMNAYFYHAFSSAISFVDDCISKARPEPQYFYSDIQGLFELNHFLEKIFGEKVLSDLRDIVNTCRKRFLITLDGFDTFFDEFRRDSLTIKEELEIKAKFEVDWLRSLLQLVLKIRSNTDPANKLYDLIDFCITVPKDRFYEVRTTERDSYRYHKRYESVDWSGIELAILLRKRLEELCQCTTDKKLKPNERLEYILKQYFPNLPQEISLTLNGRNYSMPLFMYILRHTCWRPREILLYYATILAAAEDLRKKKGRKISTEAVRRIIKETTLDIIESEFINEFESMVNIRDIINGFYTCKQFLTHNTISDILAKLDFRFAIGEAGNISTSQKIIFLYEIGFIGILVTPELQDMWHIKTRHSFYFNERDTILQGGANKRMEELTFIIHPMFTEYLQIDTSDNELVLELNWDYLYETESLLFR